MRILHFWGIEAKAEKVMCKKNCILRMEKCHADE